MSVEDTPTADEIEASVAEDLEAGVQSFSDGTNSVTAMDPEKRLAAANKLRQNDSRNTPLASVFKNTVQLRSPGGGFR